jgi:hypothetical protein
LNGAKLQKVSSFCNFATFNSFIYKDCNKMHGQQNIKNVKLYYSNFTGHARHDHYKSLRDSTIKTVVPKMKDKLLSANGEAITESIRTCFSPLCQRVIYDNGCHLTERQVTE